MSKGKLYLIPTFIGSEEVEHNFPLYNVEVIHVLHHFFVEKAKSARAFLKKVAHPTPMQELRIEEIPKHGPSPNYLEWLSPLLKGESAGVISEAGLPAIADPGNSIVSEAHRLDIAIEPLIGPNSMIMALMASGLNGQSFAFHGYLPIDKRERTKQIKFLEHLVISQHQTQIFMETPYRNNQLLADVLKVAKGSTKLCIAANIQSPKAFIKTMTIEEWQTQTPNLHKQPAVFLMG